MYAFVCVPPAQPVGVITQSDILGLAYVHATMRAPPVRVSTLTTQNP